MNHLSMTRNWFAAVLAVVLLVTAFAGPVAAQPTGGVDECQNAENGPGSNGPPGFVAGLVPDFIGDLIGGLPVPNFVKAFFGAPTC